MRISESDLVKKLLRQVLEAEPEELALMAGNLLGVVATYDPAEHCQWDVSPGENYCGAFDVEFSGTSPNPNNHQEEAS